MIPDEELAHIGRYAKMIDAFLRMTYLNARDRREQLIKKQGVNGKVDYYTGLIEAYNDSREYLADLMERIDDCLKMAELREKLELDDIAKQAGEE